MTLETTTGTQEIHTLVKGAGRFAIFDVGMDNIEIQMSIKELEKQRLKMLREKAGLQERPKGGFWNMFSR